MTSWDAVRLVALREIQVRLRSRAFLIATGGIVAVIVAGGVLLRVFGETEALQVGLAPGTEPIGASVVALAAAADGTEVATSEVADEDDGETRLLDGDLDALVVGSPEDFRIVVDTELDPALLAVLTTIAQQEALAAEVSALGGDPAGVAESLVAATPEVSALDPDQPDGAQVLAAYVAGILIFLALMTGGQMVAQGVVEEKTSRVVELLLATLRPAQLMAGKVLGIGVVGIVQVAAIVAASVGTVAALGLIETSALPLGATAGWTLVWFVIGYLTYALLLAGLAALVSRQEEVGSVTAPVITLMIIPYIIGISIGTWEPDNPLVVWLSYLPFSSPFVMPIRVAGGSVGTLEALVSVGISLLVIPLLVWLAGRMYAGAVLQTGARMKVLQALRG